VFLLRGLSLPDREMIGGRRPARLTVWLRVLALIGICELAAHG
jgi:hypothetical protein